MVEVFRDALEDIGGLDEPTLGGQGLTEKPSLAPGSLSMASVFELGSEIGADLGVDPVDPVDPIVDPDDRVHLPKTSDSAETDPIKVYFKEIRQFPLLSRAMEAELAGQIVTGEKALIQALLETPAALEGLKAFGEAWAGRGGQTLETDPELDGSRSDSTTEPRNESALAVVADIERTLREAIIYQQSHAQAWRESAERWPEIWAGYLEIQERARDLFLSSRLDSRLYAAMVNRLMEWEAAYQANADALDAVTGDGGVTAKLLELFEFKRERSLFTLKPEVGLDQLDQLVQVERSVQENPGLMSLWRANDSIYSACQKSWAELKDLLKIIEVARRGVSQARRQLVEANLRLVVSVAKTFQNRGLSLSDLIQEGNIGLIKAVDRFDGSLGFRFSTFASYYVRQAITQALADQTRVIRVPSKVLEVVYKLHRAQKALAQESSREPTIEEVAERAGVPLEKAKAALKVVREPISLETPIGAEGEGLLGDFIEDPQAVNAIDSIMRRDLETGIQFFLGSLSEREADIIRARFGIGEKMSQTLEEVSQTFQLSRERVRQIEAKALAKLRQLGELRRFSSLMEN
ncbi:MAG: sigma-70 family RNA polymerase sigma factor [Deltaproteobacteria bacterium]|nr:sigma-70 family RNA polymerase sigma factor [Deltaproteobacteria bacterium]